jgi:hypothetical protein
MVRGRVTNVGEASDGGTCFLLYIIIINGLDKTLPTVPSSVPASRGRQSLVGPLSLYSLRPIVANGWSPLANEAAQRDARTGSDEGRRHPSEQSQCRLAERPAFLRSRECDMLTIRSSGSDKDGSI